MTPTARQISKLVQRAAGEGGDESYAKMFEQQRADGFGWRVDGLGDWSTPAIFEKLRELGVDTDEQRFREQARAVRGPKELHQTWSSHRERLHSFWDDFPFLGCEELWRRLTPDLVCPEFIADRLDAIVLKEGQESSGDPGPADLQAAMALIDYLEPFPPDRREEQFYEVLSCGLCAYDEWLCDLVLARGREHPDAVTRIADFMSTITSAARYQSYLAVALAAAGRREEAVKRAQTNLLDFPDDIWVRILAGDVYHDLGQATPALQLYETALSMADNPNDWDAAAQRIRDLLEEKGRGDEWWNIHSHCPRPLDSARRLGDMDGDRVPAALSHGRPRRNDPCPCGSGRKYKKCCLGRRET